MEEKKLIDSPRLTVITPTYNRADFLVETIESILSQDFTDFEYLILDDGSTDNTKKVVEPFLSDSRVTYLYHDNRGEAETVNWGWSLKKGDYFTQVNSDDPILPGLFREMVTSLDEAPNYVLAYPDFYITNDQGDIVEKTQSPDWNFKEALLRFSCYAASPGTFLRCSAFADWKMLKKKDFKHINDIEMYWNMALVGDFLHVPQFLATWRTHGDSISAERYKSIPEVHKWLDCYFNQSNIPQEIYAIRHDVRKIVHDYCISLIDQSDLENKERQKKVYHSTYIGQFSNLQIGDNDLIGNKFNGHDLHLALRERSIDSRHLVWNKESDDDTTYLISSRRDREQFKSHIAELQNDYALDGTYNPLMLDILYSDQFLHADIVHMHLMHNGLIDLHLLPLLTKLKPTVWTIHDPWVLSGHCVDLFGCEKWIDGCGNCPQLDVPFKIKKDNTALNAYLKKDAIQRSNFEVIVASQYMHDKLSKSPNFHEKKIHVIPFGVDHNIFTPRDKKISKIKLGIPDESLVIAFRADTGIKKGLDYALHVLRNIRSDKKIYTLVVGGDLDEKVDGIEYREFGWIKDDYLMADIYNAADIFMMPSIVESFGMMAIEAMSCGTVPVVLEGTALPEVVNAPDCGIATERNRESYYKAIQQLIDHEALRISHSKKSLDHALKRYTKKAYIESILEVYGFARDQFVASNESTHILNQLKKHLVKEVVVKMSRPVHLKKNESKKHPLRSLLRRIKRYDPFFIHVYRHFKGVSSLLREVVENQKRERRGSQIVEKQFLELQSKHSLILRKLYDLENNTVIATSQDRAFNESIDQKCSRDVSRQKTKILFVGMLSSIHAARWISQFSGNTFWEVHLFNVSESPIHRTLIREKTFVIHNFVYNDTLSLTASLEDRICGVIERLNPKIVHTLEMQHASYPVLAVREKYSLQFPIWFYSCWGSDIKWFEKFPDHRKKIKKVLSKCDALFSGDKLSIHKALEDYNFKKPTLNVPSPGGYKIDESRALVSLRPPSERSVILVKGYTGWVYRHNTLFKALENCADLIRKKNMTITIFLPGEVAADVQKLEDLGLQVDIFPYTENYDDVIKLYGTSRVSLAASMSDGLPNSLLESMMMGCYPILSNTSSAGEYISPGRDADLLPPDDVAAYSEAIARAITDDVYVDSAAEKNLEIMRSHFDYESIKDRVMNFYNLYRD